MPTSVTLFEYETERVELPAETARRLSDAAGSALSVGLGDGPGSYTLTASNYVGSLVIDDVRVLIKPKIRAENLFLLLEAGISPDQWRQETFDWQTGPDLLSSVIDFFARTAETSLARGMVRSYRTVNDRPAALRGRIDVPAQLRSPGITSPIACTFDEYTADILENQYLKAAVLRARRVAGVDIDTRRMLQHTWARLDEVSDIWVKPDDFDRIVFTRLNQHYEPVLRLARLVLQNLTLIDDAGSTGASSFLVDMNLLFQRFITLRLRRALRERLHVIDEPTLYLGVGNRVAMNPDLEFLGPSSGRVEYVADVKDKLTKDGRARSSDYYQLLAYATALNLTEGMLIYATSDGSPPENEVVVRHSEQSLYTFRINLSGSSDEVDSEVNRLADWIIERTATEAA